MKFRARFLKYVKVLAIMGVMTGCSTSLVSQRQFDTPEAATAALISAAKAGNNADLAAIFGEENSEIYSSGDAISDLAGRKKFVALYAEKNQLEDARGGDRTLVLGNMDWPFPVPIVKSKSGKWYFESEEGIEEIVNRRIGKNELTAIAVSRTLAEAQKEYFNLDPNRDGVKEYAKKIRSTPGAKDGLFWARGPGEKPSPIGPLIATAVDDGYNIHGGTSPYHGYLFRILTEKNGKSLLSSNGQLTKGFAVIAYPAGWGVSGIMSFLVSEDGVVLQRDLGEDTGKIAPNIISYSPGLSWQRVEE